MMNPILPIVITMLLSSFALRMWQRHRERRRIAGHRRVEASTSPYAARVVRNREDRERWDGVDLRGLHPLNGDQVLRLLTVTDVDGVKALSSCDRP